MRIGVLALQGDFFKHAEALQKLGVEVVFVKTPADLQKTDGLIMPGGESTTLVKLLKNSDLYDKIAPYSQTHPIFGTCAGAILLSQHVENHPVESFQLIDVDIIRNAYGRQIDSFIDFVDVALGEQNAQIEAVFIRAPKFTRVGESVRIIGRHKSEDIVMVENDRVMAATFHPELTDDLRIHQYFVQKILQNQ